MNKIFILLTLIVGTGTSAFTMGNDAVRDTDRIIAQPKKVQPKKEVEMNIVAMGNDAVRDTDRIIAQPKKIV